MFSKSIAVRILFFAFAITVIPTAVSALEFKIVPSNPIPVQIDSGSDTQWRRSHDERIKNYDERVRRLELAVQELQVKVFNLQQTQPTIIHAPAPAAYKRQYYCEVKPFTENYKAYGATQLEAKDKTRMQCEKDNNEMHCRDIKCQLNE